MIGSLKASSALALLMMAGIVPAYAQTGAGSVPAAPPAPATPSQAATPDATPTPDAPQAASDTSTADIVVTAQRRSQRLQDVPISVTAVTADKLASSGVAATVDLAAVTPGLVMATSRNTITPFIRGIGTQSALAGTEGAIAVYVDGVYLPSAVSSVFSLNNVERIEVLKGPQGTLFGRNATGGLIQVVTRDPSYTTRFEGSIGYASYDTVSGNLYATGKIAENVAADIAFYGSNQSKGWGTNFYNGIDVNKENSAYVRSKIKIEAGADTSIVLSGDYGRSRGDIGQIRQPLTGSVAVGRVTQIGTIYDTNTPLTLPNKDSWQGGLSAVIRHQATKDIELVSTTAYRKLRAYVYVNADNVPQVLNDSYFAEVGESFQQELLANVTTSKFDLTAGLFFIDFTAGFNPFQLRTVVPSPNNVNRYASLHTRGIAGYSQGTYHITPTTNLTLGARYTHDELNINGRFVATAGNTVPAGTVVSSSDSLPKSQTDRNWGAVTYRAVLDQKIGPDVLVYGSVNRGYKSGAFNTSDYRQPALEPETVQAYEIGLKSTLLDRTLTFNAAAFIYDYNNIQLQVRTTTGATTVAAPTGHVKGVEGELNWSPRLTTGKLQFSASGSYLDATYGNFPNAPTTIPNPPTVGGNTAGSVNATGNRMILAPRFTGSLSADYQQPVSDKFDIGLNANIAHNSGFFWESDNRIKQKAYDLINAQVRLTPSDGAWGLRFWMRNLLDTQYYSTASTTAFGDGGSAGAPRTYGVAFDFKFGG